MSLRLHCICTLYIAITQTVSVWCAVNRVNLNCMINGNQMYISLVYVSKRMIFNLPCFLLIKRFSYYPHLYCHALQTSVNYPSNPLCAKHMYKECHAVNYSGYFSCDDCTCMEALVSCLGF